MPSKETLRKNGALLNALQHAPALLASIGSTLKLEAQYILAATLCHSLFDGYSTEEKLLLAVIEAAIDEQDVQLDDDDDDDDDDGAGGGGPNLPSPASGEPLPASCLPWHARWAASVT